MSYEVMFMARGRPYKCPWCKSHLTSQKGQRIVKDGVHKLRFCRNCRRKFTVGAKKPLPVLTKTDG